MTEHFDDVAVRSFAKMMAEKMAISRAKGRSGWDNPNQCSVAYLQKILLEHMAKGDPVDVANICMMLRHYDAKTMPMTTAADGTIDIYCELKHGQPPIPLTFPAVPRKDEYVFINQTHYRVCQVQYHITDEPNCVLLILQEEK